MKRAGNQLPKQLKCSHCGRNNYAVEKCFAFHPEKRPTSERKMLWRRRLAPWRRVSRVWRHPAKFWIYYLPPELRPVLPLHIIICLELQGRW